MDTYQNGDFEVLFETDTDKLARIEKLRKSKPIEITGLEITPSDDIKRYQKNALDYGKKLRGSYTNKDNGEKINLAKPVLEEIIHHDGYDIPHLQSFAAIPQIIENSIYIDSDYNNDTEKHPNIEKYDYYVSGLKIGDVDYTVKSVIAQDRNGNRYYDHALTQIEKEKLIDETTGITSPARQQSVSKYKDKRLFSILQIKMQKNIGGVEISSTE
jgi:hypothetical protein